MTEPTETNAVHDTDDAGTDVRHALDEAVVAREAAERAADELAAAHRRTAEAMAAARAAEADAARARAERDAAVAELEAMRSSEAYRLARKLLRLEQRAGAVRSRLGR